MLGVQDLRLVLFQNSFFHLLFLVTVKRLWIHQCFRLCKLCCHTWSRMAQEVKRVFCSPLLLSLCWTIMIKALLRWRYWKIGQKQTSIRLKSWHHLDIPKHIWSVTDFAWKVHKFFTSKAIHSSQNTELNWSPLRAPVKQWNIFTDSFSDFPLLTEWRRTTGQS